MSLDLSVAERPAPPLADLAARLTGRLVTAADPEWDVARMAWLVNVPQHPVAVVQAAGADDVAATVRFAAEHGLRVAPQGTGHGAAPLAGRLADALLLRTGAMRAVSVDPVSQLARVEAGAVWADVVAAAAEHGLAVQAGSAADVGVVGYVLGGGLSWLGRKHGLAARDVVAMEVVTADGEQRRIDADQDADLLWALKGGGPLAVVTAVTLRLHPLRELVAGAMFWPLERAGEVLRAWRAWTDAVPEETMSCGRLLRLPPLEDIPEPLRGGAFVVVEVAHQGTAEGADGLLAPLRALGPAIDTVATVPVPALAALHMDPPGPVPGAGDGTLLRDLDDAAVDALLGAAGPGAPCPLLSVELRHLGGALAREPEDCGAAGALDAAFSLFCVGIAPVPEAERVVLGATAAVLDALSPWDAGRSFRNLTESHRPLERFHGEATVARLRAVRAAYDPTGLVLGNHPTE
ncbi:MAG: FAD-binding oxidoreductase [Motilibacteraceae bacterium]